MVMNWLTSPECIRESKLISFYLGSGGLRLEFPEARPILSRFRRVDGGKGWSGEGDELRDPFAFEYLLDFDGHAVSNFAGGSDEDDAVAGQLPVIGLGALLVIELVGFGNGRATAGKRQHYYQK